MTMLPTHDHVRDVYLGKDGILTGIPAGTLFVDSSTISIAVTRELAAEVKRRNCKMIDAPVSGGTHGAEAATLTFMVGGDAEDLERARPILQAMGKNIVHAGANRRADGQNLQQHALRHLDGRHHRGFGARRCKWARSQSAVRNHAHQFGTNFALLQMNPYPGVMEKVPSSRGYTGGFRSEFQLKDMLIAAELANQSRVVTTLGTVACNMFALHCDAGYGKHDYSSIMVMMDPKSKSKAPK